MNVKITNLPRFLLSVTILLGIIIVASLFITTPTLSHGELNYETIFVNSGDTLWEIAEDQKQENPYYENKDIRAIIENIKTLNELKTSSLNVGQELLIPVI